MDGRGRRDAASARSGAFTGRQVPLQMGKVRVGGSGRSVPAVLAAGSLRNPPSASQETSAARSPLVSLEPHPRSPFHRREELSKIVVQGSDEGSSTRFQVKKTAVSYSRSARSPQVPLKEEQSVTVADETRSERQFSHKEEVQVSATTGFASDSTNGLTSRKPQIREEDVMDKVSKDNTGRTAADATGFDDDADTSLHHSSKTEKTSGRKTLALHTTGAGAGTFVSSMPSLTKLHSSFTARELALFTRRLDKDPTTETPANKQIRYHVASHPNPTSANIYALHHQASEQGSSRHIEETHQRSLSSSDPQYEVEKSQLTRERPQTESSWRRVDSSIEHIYENPSIDMVQLHLLHSHHSASGQKKRKRIERERVLAAASGLREQQSEEQRRQEEQQQRKLRIQQLSEAIRLQNQRMAMKARANHAGRFVETHARTNRPAANSARLPQRKPPVPRLSGNIPLTRHAHPKRTRKAKDDVSHPKARVSASILMGTASETNLEAKTQAEEPIVEVHEKTTEAQSTESHTAKRKPATLTRTPRSSKTKRQSIPSETSQALAAVQAREVRRAVAREYMQLQKHSRRIWSTNMKKQSQREQEKRQQKLEILEATRLKNLRLSKKRANARENQRPMDFELTDFSMKSAPAISAPMLELAVDAVSKHHETRKLPRSSESSVLNEPQVDNENNRAVGNLMVPDSFSKHGTASHSLQSLKANSRSIPSSELGLEKHPNADDRVRKLLELREKAAALSARLSGLRSRESHEEALRSGVEISEGNRSVPDTSGAIVCSDDQVLTDRNSHEGGALYEYGVERDGSEGENDCISEDSKSDARQNDEMTHGNVSADATNHADTENWFAGSVPNDSRDNGDEEICSDTRHRQVAQHGVELNAPLDILEVHEEDSDIDIRSIGVYNIGVVWPIHQKVDDVTEGVSETNNVLRSRPDSLSDSSLSDKSSCPASPAVSEGNLSPQFRTNRDDIHDSAEAFEVAFYKQMKNRLQASSPKSNDEIEVDNTTRENREGSEGNVSDDSDCAELSVWNQQRRDHMVGDSFVVQRRSRQNEFNRPSVGLMRLLRETDDSLSVVDRAAREMYRQQRERSERVKENELQERIEAEKQVLLEKDMALEAVMATLTGKRSEGYDDDEMSEVGGGIDAQTDGDEAALQSTQFKRLEEIMEEVEKERAREKQAAGNSHTGASFSGTDHDDDFKNDQVNSQDAGQSKRQSAGVSVVSSSPAFWDHMVSESTENEFDGGHPNHLPSKRQHVDIDDSELQAQRDARLREEDEEMDDHIDSPPRVHSPRTLSKRLMAAVDYQEAIFEAHMQLSMMEHAHELETVQAETITLAHAFKEEMEHNATSHQLALDHATLEKKFDGDMHDVIEQLETIRQVEEQERLAKESRMEQELKQAHLRECSIQTEPSQRVDAATSAALYVDTSTSPVRFAVDAAVQHDMIETKLTVPSPPKQSPALDYASEENEGTYEEAFEEESQIETSVQDHKRTTMSEVSSIAESPMHSQTREDNESDIHSVPSDEEELLGNDYEVESGGVRSIIDEESALNDSTSNSAVDSAIEEAENGRQSGNVWQREGDLSSSMEYADDFEASSPKLEVTKGELSHEEDVVQDDIDYAESRDGSKTIDNIEEDVDAESSSVTIKGEVASEREEIDYYSSQFDETSSANVTRDQPTKESGVKRADSDLSRHDVPSALMIAGCRGENIMLPANFERQITKDVSEAYVLDLKRRTQAEASLLEIRLQTVELKFQHEVKELEKMIKRKQSDARAVQELRMRKENLTVALLAEKAKVESLKAASTARYYQDFHTFRSLSYDWPYEGHGFGIGNNVAMASDAKRDAYDTEYVGAFAPSSIASVPSYPGQSRLTGQVDDESALQQYADEYSNDFLTGQDTNDNFVTNESAAREKDTGEESRSVVSEHSDADSSASEQDEVLDTSEVIEEDPINEAGEDGIPDAEVEEESQYDDEFASMSEDTSVKDAASTSGADIVEDSEAAERSDGSSAQNEIDSDEDFASMSESTLNQAVEPTQELDMDEHLEAESGDQDVEDNSDAGEILSEDGFADVETASRTSPGKKQSGEISDSNEERQYSDDAFESGQLEPSVVPHSKHAQLMLGEQSISVAEGQSSSEDSSTTKLLVAEVAKLQTQGAAGSRMQNDDVDNKLARKKAKTEKLLQAKGRLLQQQKEAFRRDEEKRQVDFIAKLALGMDVEVELQRAKAEIAQQLGSEFDSLQHMYPMLRATNSRVATTNVGAADNSPIPTQTILRDTVRPDPVIPAVVKTLSEKGSLDRLSMVGDGYEDDYDVESFDEEQSERQGEISEIESDEAGGIESEQLNSNLDIDEDTNDEVASEVPSHQSNVDEDLPPSAVDEEEEIIDIDQGVDVVGEILNDSEEYENDYDNESFDDAQYALGGEAPTKTKNISTSVSINRSLENAGDDDENAYSDEGFDSASTSFSYESPTVPGTAASLDTFHDRAAGNSSEGAAVVPAMISEEMSAPEEDLAEAIASVTARLEDKSQATSLSLVQSDYHSQEVAFECATKENKVIGASFSVSISRDEEEESLTKSIEERNARLQALKQKILYRKNEILAVQKQLRVEQRKEQLTAEEKVLWDEMESVERLLHADEAALVLCRQRNRLEMMYLEARQLEYSVAEMKNKSPAQCQVDLLADFDYIEVALVDELQKCRSAAVVDASVLALRRSQATRRCNLLEGYIHVEAAEPARHISLVVTATNPLSPVTVAHQIDDDNKSYSNVNCNFETNYEVIMKDEGKKDRQKDNDEDSEDELCQSEQQENVVNSAIKHDAQGDVEESSNGETFALVSTHKVAQNLGDEQFIELKKHSVFETHEDGNYKFVAVRTEVNAYQTGGACSKLPDALDLLEKYTYIEEAEDPSNMYTSSIDLLGSFDVVEVVDVLPANEPHTEYVEERSNIDLLTNFDYVETAEAAIRSLTVVVIDAQPHSEDNIVEEESDVHEEIIHSSLSEVGVADDIEAVELGATFAQVPTEFGGLDYNPADFELEYPTKLAETVIADEEVGYCSASVEESIDATKPGAPDLTDNTNNIDNHLAPSEDQQATFSRHQELTDRVSTLLLGDLLQTLEKDIIASTRLKHSAQVVSREYTRDAKGVEVHDHVEIEVASTESPTQDANEAYHEDLNGSSFEDGDVGNGSEIEENFDQSDENLAIDSYLDLEVSTTTNQIKEQEAVRVISPTASAVLVGNSDVSESYSMERFEVSEESEEPSPSKERANTFHRVGTPDEFESKHGGLQDGIPSVVRSARERESKVLAEDVPEIINDSTDKLSESQHVADEIFATVFDAIITSELQLWPRQRHKASPASTRDARSNSHIPTVSAAGMTREATLKQGYEQEPRRRDRQFALQIVSQIDIVDGKLHLPALTSIALEGRPLQTARPLYDTIEEIAYSCFDALQQSAPDERNLDSLAVLAAIHRHVRTEIDELLALREQSEGELERQLQLLSDEPGDGITGNILLSHNCLPSNVGSMVSKVQMQLTGTADMFSTIVPTPRSGIWPRTPTSRAKSTSVLSSLQIQQDEQLQQRITSMILSDLLHDAGLS